MTTTSDKLMQDPKFQAASAQASLVQDVQEAFSIAMEERNISHEVLAERLRWPLGRVRRFFVVAPSLQEIALVAKELDLQPIFRLESLTNQQEKG
jgi:hypothetical protein